MLVDGCLSFLFLCAGLYVVEGLRRSDVTLFLADGVNLLTYAVANLSLPVPKLRKIFSERLQLLGLDDTEVFAAWPCFADNMRARVVASSKRYTRFEAASAP